MNSTILSSPSGLDTLDAKVVDAPIGAVSWGAIFAGAAAAAALSLILLILGVGLGLSSVSPWSGQGITAATFGVSTVLWLTLTQLAASGMGGYLAGRLRIRWMRTKADEVYFRDTAHGFLAWAVATLVTAAMLGSAIGSIFSTGAQVAGTVTAGTAAAAATAMQRVAPAMDSTDQVQGHGYFVDALFRRPVLAAERATTAADSAAVAPDAAASATPPANTMPATAAPSSMDAADAARASTEAGRIFASAIAKGTMPPEDTKYLGQLVSQRTGLSTMEAEKRVNDIFTGLQTQLRDAETRARETADKSRKASSYAALWVFISLLSGAFVASLMATFGGRQRDLA